ncbi:MAG TPA: ABC transporter permease [Solirubrobacterales bacterium]|jgi:putative spermidine/putrescine transport system permease protein|nr:ABC transporter permease [Solirubrobacterales bacterium]
MTATLTRVAYQGSVVAIYVFLLAPLVFVIAVSINGGAVPSFPPTDPSLRWYWSALTQQSFVDGMVTSAWLALASTAVATPIGIAAALGIYRGRFRGKEILESLFLAPLIVPGIVIGIALLAAFVAVDLRDAPLRLLAAHVVLVLPYSIRTVLASLARIDLSLEEAAMTLGATRWSAFRLVILPLMRPGIVAGMVFAAILSFDDIAVALFLVDAKSTTLPVAILSYLQYSFDPSIAALSSMLIIGTLTIAVVLERVFGLKSLLGG